MYFPHQYLCVFLPPYLSTTFDALHHTEENDEPSENQANCHVPSETAEFAN
jgi:hypothetical protein